MWHIVFCPSLLQMHLNKLEYPPSHRLIYFNNNKRKRIERNVGLLKSMNMYCIQNLVGAPTAWNTPAMWCGMEAMTPWRYWGVTEAQIALMVALSPSELLSLVARFFLFTVPQRFIMGLRSGEFTGKSITGIPWSPNQVLVPLAVWAGAKCCWEMKWASP